MRGLPPRAVCQKRCDQTLCVIRPCVRPKLVCDRDPQPDGRLEVENGPPPLDAFVPNNGSAVQHEQLTNSACEVDADGWQVGA